MNTKNKRIKIAALIAAALIAAAGYAIAQNYSLSLNSPATFPVDI